MIDHTVEQVEEQERRFKNENCPLVPRDIHGRNFRYYQVPQSFFPPLPDFIIRATNNATKRYVIGVSNSVPEMLQDYFAMAEYVEFVEIGLEKMGRVRRAEEVVMLKIPRRLLVDYARRKINLFKKELELDSQQSEFYLLGEDGRREFAEAISFLESKIR